MIGGGFTGQGGGMRIGVPVEHAADRRRTLRRFTVYARPFTGPLIVIALAVIVDVAMTAYAPRFIRTAVDDLATFLNGGMDSATATRLVGGAMMTTLALFLGAWVFNGIGRWLMVGIGQDILATIREQVFAKVQRLHMTYFDQTAAGDLLSRMTNDTAVIDRVLRMGAIRMFQSVLLIGAILAAMLAMSWRLAAISFTVLPAMFLITAYFSRRARVAYRKTRQTISGVSARLEQNIVGIRETQAFARQGQNSTGFRRVNAENRDANVNAETITAAFAPALDILATIGIAIVLVWGGYLASLELVTIGIIVAFIQYVRRFFQPMRSISMLWAHIQSAIAGMERIFELLDEPRVSEDPPDASELPAIRGHLELRGVSFAYVADTPVLRDIDLVIEPGTTVALVGRTGAGKTTIASLAQRLYEPQQGRILVDGIDVATVTRASLRRQLGVVTQDPFLFSGTVGDNIRYGRLEASDHEVEEAAQRARAHQFIDQLPDRYATVLHERGRNLSRGQQQLVAIARALLADPRILILDEATANIDTRTERMLQEGLAELMQGRTGIVIAHRLSTVRAANQIVVIEDGRIAERGSHDQLLAAGGLYREIYESQFRVAAGATV